MREALQRLGLVLLLLTAAGGRSWAGTDGGPEELPEPPPAALAPSTDPADLPEPPPAPLLVPPAPDVKPGPQPPPSGRPNGRAFRNTAWAGAAITLALVTTGTVFGLLAQQRADSLSRSTTQRIDGLMPIYDAAQQAAFADLQSQGQSFNNVTIACFLAGGATALTSAILFWNAGRLAARDKPLALVPLLAPQGGTVTLMGHF